MSASLFWSWWRDGDTSPIDSQAKGLVQDALLLALPYKACGTFSLPQASSCILPRRTVAARGSAPSPPAKKARQTHVRLAFLELVEGIEPSTC